MKVNFKWLQSPAVKKITTALTDNNNPTFSFVGGCVRDSILGASPKDFDIASILSPLENMKLLKKHNIKVVPLAAKYGTILAIVAKHNFEITTLRKDIKTYGRAAEVKFTSNYKEDAKRRDFTINALYLNPITLELTDYFNGLNDLKMGSIKFIGNSQHRIDEDYLRILRFIRFYTYFSKQKVSLVEESILKNNTNKLLLLSKERINIELQKIILHKNATKGIKLLNKTGIALVLFRQEKLNYTALSKLKTLAKNNNIKLSYILALMAVIKDTNAILQLNLIKEEKSFLRIKTQLIKIIKSQPKSSYLLARFNSTMLEYTVMLLLATTNKRNKNYNYYLELLLTIKQKTSFKFNINGNDLISLGMVSNKTLGSLLLNLKQWGLEHNINNKAAYLKKAKELIRTLKS